MSPRKPAIVSAYADACLQAISAAGLAGNLSLGGAFALAFYFEYRETHDIEAWWVPAAGAEERRRVVSCVESALQQFGEVSRRAWGDVVSVDLRREGKARPWVHARSTRSLTAPCTLQFPRSRPR